MLKKHIHNINITGHQKLPSPRWVKFKLPISKKIISSINEQREAITRILRHEDKRLLVIVGPCSIHDPESAIDYAERLSELSKMYRENLYIMMRVYFEKPRTNIGWRGLIVDPHLDGSYRFRDGLYIARGLLLKIAAMGLPIGNEVLDPIIPQYIADLSSWAAIGARTTESQTHRELSSGLSMPVGFKNGTEGDLNKAVNAIKSASFGHGFIGIDQSGRTRVFHSRGNDTGHIILRGGSAGPNYYEKDIIATEKLVNEAKITPSIIVDCSHANSNKDYRLQASVMRETLDIKRKHRSIVGIMLESHVQPGRQDIVLPHSNLEYGVSITDGCMGWDETRDLIAYAAEMSAKVI